MQMMVVAHHTVPAVLPTVDAHNKSVIPVVVASDLVTIWLVISCVAI